MNITPTSLSLSAFIIALFPLITHSQLPLDINSPVGNKIYNMPENSWTKLNQSNFNSVWTPTDQRPVNGFNTYFSPTSILGAWSSMAWDSNRGKLVFFGGGHANYAGNEIYLWDSVSGLWERGSLPSEIKLMDGGLLFHSIGGYMDAPIASHTYDNNEFLPIADRFVNFGGAAYTTGGAFIHINANGDKRQTGPYFWNPTKADPFKVGGSDGTQVKPEMNTDVSGGFMWENRDNISDIKPSNNSGWSRTWLQGTSAYSSENNTDVIYISDVHELFKYTVTNVDDPSQDIWEKVGDQGMAASGQGAGAYSPIFNVYLRTYSDVFGYWDLNNPTAKKITFRPDDPSGEFAWEKLEQFGMDYDTERDRFILWDGSDQVWALHPPKNISPSGWKLKKIYDISFDSNFNVPNTSEADFISTGILGKWKYLPKYDVFLGVNRSVAGDIWAYKPNNWNPQINHCATATAQNTQVFIPCVTVAGVNHLAQLSLKQYDPIQYSLKRYAVVTGNFSQCASFDEQTLKVHLPCVDVEGERYQANLILRKLKNEPYNLILELVDYSLQ